MVNSVYEVIKGNGGRFLKEKNGGWIELGDREAKEKCSHAIRDHLSNAERSKQAAQKQTIKDYGFLRNLQLPAIDTSKTNNAAINQHASASIGGAEAGVDLSVGDFGFGGESGELLMDLFGEELGISSAGKAKSSSDPETPSRKRSWHNFW